MIAGNCYPQKANIKKNITISGSVRTFFLLGLLLFSLSARSQNSAPVFIQPGTQIFSICESSGANDISALLAVFDADQAQTETWIVSRNPTNGTLGGFPATALSNGDTVTPTGLTYTPNAGFSGFDTFVVQVSDGIDVVADTLIAIINPTPTLSSSHVMPSVCSGTLVSYIPMSPVAGATFNWSRQAVAGISDTAASGTGSPNEYLYDTTAAGVTVDYLYTIVANSCVDTQSVFMTIKPNPVLSSPLTDTICDGDTVKYTPMSLTTGVSFIWSRAAVSGIVPATSAGTDSINESLINNTPSAINAVYQYELTADGCSTLDNVNVTVNAPAAGVAITTEPASSLCLGTMYQNFGTSTVPPAGVSYTWTVINASLVATGNNGQYSIVSFNNPGSATVILTSNILNSNCLAASFYNATIGNAENPSAGVIYYNGQFVYLDNTATTYQWGYDDVTTLSPTIITDATFQSYPITNPDFSDNYYWVMTTENGCTQKTYYNAPLAVHNLQQGNVSLKIFPNPATSRMAVDVDVPQGSVTNVSLIDMLGQTIKTISGTGHNMQFDVADMPAGCYLVSCTQNGVKIATARFIKN